MEHWNPKELQKTLKKQMAAMSPEEKQARLKEIAPWLFEEDKDIDEDAVKKAQRLLRRRYPKKTSPDVEIFTDKKKGTVTVIMWGLYVGSVNVVKGQFDDLIWKDRDGDTMPLIDFCAPGK